MGPVIINIISSSETETDGRCVSLRLLGAE